ncbi:MAG: anaerobic ribonucleoside-triphosphate reductase activating protein [Spirochaetaceae bacterium]|jgi:pyruvate formate lyase activating enzyme|nr:anaerobic ribonucleoside-triphosphate reductase activating protein [Spirochaetaceae bacterium]
MAAVVLRKTTLLDYPGKVAAALFFPGCNLRCPWCHNRELIRGDAAGELSPEEALGHLEKRRAVLGGVVLSGGEPTLYRGLAGLIRRIHGLGLPVKLDTNGMDSGALEALLRDRETRPDYIALDLKAAPERYGSLLPSPAAAGEAASIRARGELERSAALIRQSGIEREFRTVVLPGSFLGPADIAGLAPLADDSPWYFRPFRPGNCLDPAWDRLEAPRREEVEALAETARSLGKRGMVPGV